MLETWKRYYNVCWIFRFWYLRYEDFMSIWFHIGFQLHVYSGDFCIAKLSHYFCYTIHQQNHARSILKYSNVLKRNYSVFRLFLMRFSKFLLFHLQFSCLLCTIYLRVKVFLFSRTQSSVAATFYSFMYSLSYQIFLTVWYIIFNIGLSCVLCTLCNAIKYVVSILTIMEVCLTNVNQRFPAQ